MADPQVIFLGTDLYASGRVISYPPISEMKSFKNDKLITNVYQIQVNNEDDFFSLGNPKSPLFGENISYKPIKVIGSNGEDLWNGSVTSIPRDHEAKTAVINSKNEIVKFFETIVVYESSDWETCANAFVNICISIGFTKYNVAAAQESINKLTDANCYVKVFLSQEDGMQFQSIIEKLGEFCNADVYSHNNDVYFEHWVRPVVYSSTIEINEDDFREMPNVAEDIESIINDYSIGYAEDNGVPATDEGENNIGVLSRTRFGKRSLPELSSGDGAQIMMKDEVSAVYVGESYIRRTQKGIDSSPQNPQPLVRTNFSIYSDIRSYINLKTIFKSTFSEEGWVAKLFEIFEFVVDEDTDRITILAYEVES